MGPSVTARRERASTTLLISWARMRSTASATMSTQSGPDRPSGVSRTFSGGATGSPMAGRSRLRRPSLILVIQACPLRLPMMVSGTISTERTRERSGSKAKEPTARGPVPQAPGSSESWSMWALTSLHHTSAASGESVSKRATSPSVTNPSPLLRNAVARSGVRKCARSPGSSMATVVARNRFVAKSRLTRGTIAEAGSRRPDGSIVEIGTSSRIVANNERFTLLKNSASPLVRRDLRGISGWLVRRVSHPID